MNTALAPDLSQSVPASVRIGKTSQQLGAIIRPDCAAAIWHRPALPTFRDWIEALPPANLPQIRTILCPGAVDNAVRHVCDAAGMPNGPLREWLIDDIARLADIFTQTTQTPWLRLRLDVITTNACRKFHIDAVTSRLVCTYRGTGTQYGTMQYGGDPDPIFTVPTGSPIVLRGTLWPEQPASGLHHRSPPIEGSGETRLVLVLDPISDPQE